MSVLEYNRCSYLYLRLHATHPMESFECASLLKSVTSCHLLKKRAVDRRMLINSRWMSEQLTSVFAMSISVRYYAYA